LSDIFGGGRNIETIAALELSDKALKINLKLLDYFFR